LLHLGSRIFSWFRMTSGTCAITLFRKNLGTVARHARAKTALSFCVALDPIAPVIFGI
jgi:hypothetical protein